MKQSSLGPPPIMKQSSPPPPPSCGSPAYFHEGRENHCLVTREAAVVHGQCNVEDATTPSVSRDLMELAAAAGAHDQCKTEEDAATTSVPRDQMEVAAAQLQ